MTKERFYDILLTALIGAGIAFLQSFLVGLSASDIPTANPQIAALSAGALKLIVNTTYRA